MEFLKKILAKKSSSIDWEKVSYSEKVYPQHSFTLLKLTMPNGKPGTGWVDKAYRKYEFKEFCPYHVRISIDLTDKIAEDNPDLDMGTIEDFFLDGLKKICICHSVSRLTTDKGLDMLFYAEKNVPAAQFLTMSAQSEHRFVSFTYKIDFDPKWRKVNKLLNAQERKFGW